MVNSSKESSSFLPSMAFRNETVSSITERGSTDGVPPPMYNVSASAEERISSFLKEASSLTSLDHSSAALSPPHLERFSE